MREARNVGHIGRQPWLDQPQVFLLIAYGCLGARIAHARRLYQLFAQTSPYGRTTFGQRDQFFGQMRQRREWRTSEQGCGKFSARLCCECASALCIPGLRQILHRRSKARI